MCGVPSCIVYISVNFAFDKTIRFLIDDEATQCICLNCSDSYNKVNLSRLMGQKLKFIWPSIICSQWSKHIDKFKIYIFFEKKRTPKSR